MFKTKNLSPQQLSAFTALILSIPISLGIWIIEPDWKIAVGSLVLTFLGSYLLIRTVLESFIYRKIKLIYKFIYQTKASKREETYYKYILPQKGIDEVREDVEKWAEQRSAEIELLKNNEAYRKEFLQNLAHEFKTPIFAIQGYVDTLLSGAMESTDVRKRFLENTARNVDRMVNLVKDLDEISRLESGEQPLYKENFVIQELIKEVYETLSIKTTAKNIKCSIKKGCEYPITVFADQEKIRQVMNNLLENAVKYGKQDGTIVASIYRTDDEHVLIEFSDDGIGIAEEHLPRIFERFYRTDRGRSRDKGGTGLGLAICKHIIEAHGQTMHVRSKLDVGTTIGFTLDAKRE
ncbi:MAG: sensor histidine kinase [Sediminibacterium sp. Gen4]|jgi:two-component system, OmpR family, phosphate regulon sensor histidine kinase PhoR|uniref:sensor histidine kinase n=1 Tax=unclassified Sediminibacterium TaxID=2635961 RepID=UPI0015BB53CD|nr:MULTISPECIES: ATP-binding protein [unclassified Sediminibacterium]MBW0161457.1 cell wall metabolism sensor histidine kinase WalK [Sediminibacterium sp.]MBW0164033.1 cell wall metabolism sensor histidine kinase WalK [Sediminibacterium sp.]NWK66108.1 sensor histidine kinase [Sediminibacterium sp. Gen4]